ncbi:MAG: transglutaminaseTgpA domain-containing protein [Planctomycetota bacterium]|nr:transglutaminaseTgpA domain-containing protein [Planctomycetota bacterium]MDA1143020.1 transglutaminaseTgpA domain-containing protein [Planctomycetota bacterium]
MSNPRRTACMLLVVEAIGFGVYWQQLIPLLLILLALALIGLSGVFTFRISARVEALISLGLGLPFLMWWFYYVRLEPGTTGIAGYNAIIRPSYSETALISLYLMTLQMFQLFLKRERMSPRFVFYGLLAMVGAGNVSGDAAFSTSYQYLSIAFLSLCACFAKCGDRTSPRPIGRVLLPVLLLSWLATTSMYSNRASIHNFFRHFESSFREFALKIVTKRSPSFSAKGRLDEIINRHFGEESKRIAVWMNVERGPSPGYLRGMAFDRFDGKEWHPVSEPRESKPPRQAPAALLDARPRVPIYLLCDAGMSDETLVNPVPNPFESSEILPLITKKRVTVAEEKRDSTRFAPRPVSRFLDVTTITAVSGQFLFLPPRAEWIATSSRLTLDANRIARNPAAVIPPASHESVAVYSRLGEDRNIEPPTDLYSGEEWSLFRKAQLEVPALDERIHQLALRLFEGCTTVYEKRVAVMRYFRTQFTYSYFFFTPEGKNPLTHFLLDCKAAHCEYFATSAALLLRLGGVRTRYVTGFAFPESAGGNIRVFRNRNAHAWVEAWEPGIGWVTVEATQSTLRMNPPGRMDYWLAWIEFRLMCVRDFYEDYGPLGFLMLPFGFAWHMFTSQAFAGQILKLIVLAASVFWLSQRYRRPLEAREDETGRSLLSLLRRMDRRMKKHGLVRLPNQTLMQFAEAVKSVDALPPEMKKASATWYQEFARVRFAGGANADDVERLRKA